MSHLSPLAASTQPSSLSPSAADSLRNIVAGAAPPLPVDPGLDHDYRLTLARRIIAITSEQASEYFSRPTSFSYSEQDWSEESHDFASWYIFTLAEVANKIHALQTWDSYGRPDTAQLSVGSLIKEKLVDATVRWGITRRPGVSAAVKALDDDQVLERVTSKERGTGEDDVLIAAAWICGEYSRYEYHIFIVFSWQER